MYFSGQGKLLVSRDGGTYRYVGNCSAVNFELTTETLEHKESYSGQRLTDLRLVTEKKAALTATLEEFTTANLALGLYGTSLSTTSSTVTGEALPSTVAAGDIIALRNPKISSVALKTKTGTDLTEGTDYRLYSALHGSIEILKSPATSAQPLQVDYSYAAHDNITMFSSAPPELHVRFEGLNTAASDAPVLIEFYRVLLDPLASIDLISDELASMELTGSVLVDESKRNDAALGSFGRFVQ